MTKTIKVALAGAGAFGIKHLDGIKNIDGVEVVSLISRDLEKTREVADKYGIQHVTTELSDSLALPELDAVILCTPTQMHAEQTIACLKAGKHVQVEIPLADSLKGAQDVVLPRVIVDCMIRQLLQNQFQLILITQERERSPSIHSLIIALISCHIRMGIAIMQRMGKEE